FHTGESAATLFWTVPEDGRFIPDRSVHFDVHTDGQFHTYAIPLRACTSYRGIITGLRLDPVNEGRKGDWGRPRPVGVSRPSRAGGPDPSRAPGTVIAPRPAASETYIGSPSLAVLADGTYLASHDLFGPGSTKDRTAVYASVDRGKTWARRADIP